MLFEFPFNLIGKSTMAFSTGQSLRVLKSWYTAGGPEGGFRRSLADGLSQRVVSSVAHARSLVEQAFPYWRLSTNTRQRFTAQHKYISLQLLINAVERQTFLPLSSFAGGKFLCRQLSMDRIPRGCPRENVECGPEAATGTQRQYLSDSEIYPRKYNWARVLDLVTCTRCLSCYCLLVDLLECLTFARVWWFKVYRPSYFRRQQ